MESSVFSGIPRQRSLILPDVLNPFKHEVKLDWTDILKIGLMTITIFPIRCFMIAVLFLTAWPLAYIGLAGRNKEDQSEPVTGWRHNLQTFVFLLWRSIFFFGGFHWIRTIGERASSLAAPIVAAAPHSSFFDGVLPSIIMGCSVVAKKETAYVPIFGTLIKYTQPVFVSREDPNSRLNTIKEINRRARSGGRWPQVIIFPEGTCTNRSALITFKPGAFYPGVPVQPVILRYPNRKDTLTWTWDGPGAWKLFWLSLCQFHNYLEVEYLPVYNPSAEEINDPHMYARNVRAVMARELGVPATDHTFDDCRLMMYAQKHNIPMTSGLIEFNKLNRKIGIKFDKAREMLKDFAAISEDGQITMERFCEYLHLPESEALLALFKLYDRDESGTIDFREYMIGLSLVSMPVCTEDTLKLAFKLMDLKQDGYICLDELMGILYRAFSMDEEQVKKLFHEVDQDRDGKISFDEFKAHAQKKPEYAKLFMTYQEQQTANLTQNTPSLNKTTVSPSNANGRHSNKPSCGVTSSVLINRSNHSNNNAQQPILITDHSKTE